MANVIKPKRSNTAGSVPTTSSLASGELGVNMADQKTYINNGTSVVQIGAGKLSGLADVALTSIAIGQALTWNGTSWVNTNYESVVSPITYTADFTVTTAKWVINNKSGSTATATLPAASTYPGRSLTFKNMQAQLVVSASSNVVPIDSTTAGTAILLNVVGNWATMVSDGTNWVIMQAAPNNILLLE